MRGRRPVVVRLTDPCDDSRRGWPSKPFEDVVPETEGSTMTETTDPEPLGALEPFVGQWRMTAGFSPNPADAPRALTTFEWLSGRRFLVQRWEVDHPDAPDGIAMIGFDPAREIYVQHYFDSRGVVRLYDMAFVNKVWTLQRLAEYPDFSQRFTGRFSEDDNTIAGHWESSSDGASWLHDFDLTYTRVA